VTFKNCKRRTRGCPYCRDEIAQWEREERLANGGKPYIETIIRS